MGCPSCRNQLVGRERTSPTGRGFIIHKELFSLGAPQQTKGQIRAVIWCLEVKQSLLDAPKSC